MKKAISMLLAVILCFGLMAGCAKDEPETPDDKPASGGDLNPEVKPEPEKKPEPEVKPEPEKDPVAESFLAKANQVKITDDAVICTDDSGRGELTLAKHPKKVAVLYGSQACLWYEAGGTIQLGVGGDSAVTLYEEQIGHNFLEDEGVITVATSSSGTKWDVEKIIAEKPDLILCSMGMKGFATISGPAEAAGIPVVGIQYDSVSDYLKWFKVFTALNGTENLWDEMAMKTLDSIVATIKKVPTDVARPRVLVLGAAKSLKAYGNDHSAGNIVLALGGVNVVDPEADGMLDSREISMEDIYALDPDIILFNIMGDETEYREKVAQVTDNPVWESLRAVKNNNVHFLEKGLFFNKPNHRYNESYEVMFNLLYPEAK